MRLSQQVSRLPRALKIVLASSAAIRYAKSMHAPGVDFADFGRRFALRLLLKMPGIALDYLAYPVSITRYFEFDFALQALPVQSGKCLDISSPRLFSFLVAERYPANSIWMINPDPEDIAVSQRMIAAIGATNMSTQVADLSRLEAMENEFDCIWSLSVIEHVNGAYDDTYAMKLIYDALAPGGVMIVTVPVDRRFWNEYRQVDHYGIQSDRSETGTYFFQRYYDEDEIWARLISKVPAKVEKIEWFGERIEGWFAEYEHRWLTEGRSITANDARFVADNFQRYESWTAMPGKGVCGLVLRKA